MPPQIVPPDYATAQQLYDWVNQPGADTLARWQQLTGYQHYLYLKHKSWLDSAHQRPYSVGYYDSRGAWIVRQRVSGPDYAALRASYHLWYLARQGPSGQQLLWIDDASPKGDWRWVEDMLPPRRCPPRRPSSRPARSKTYSRPCRPCRRHPLRRPAGPLCTSDWAWAGWRCWGSG